MEKSILELQGVTMSEEHRARLKDMVLSMNDKARSVADEKLAFEDEPAHYTRFLNAGA
jgi:hypothetical protein